MYSRKRLALLAVGWLAMAGAAMVLSSGFGAVADDRGCTGSPCAFPAENNVGGIIMGTARLQGNSLTAFGFDGNSYYEDTPPGRVDPVEEQIGIGISGITTPNMIIYKAWYYQDPRVADDVPVHIWANATSATLTSDTVDCGNGNNGWGGAKRCDLIANTSEIYTGYLEATTDCFSGAACSVVPDSLTVTDFWAVNPEDDQCGDFEALNSPCLQAMRDGGACVLTTCVRTDNVDGQEVFIRSHNIQAVRGSLGQDKQMLLNGLYLEMRYGKGFDRAHTPGSPRDAVWAQPNTFANGRAAFSTSGECTGGGPNTDCTIDANRNADIDGMSYDNVHNGP